MSWSHSLGTSIRRSNRGECHPISLFLMSSKVNIPIQMITDPALRDIAESVSLGKRVGEGAVLSMLSSCDVNGLGMIAGAIRQQRHGRNTFYGNSLNLNYTNVCELRCPLCAFSCDEGDDNAYVLELDEVRKRVAVACDGGADEVHIVGALNPKLPLDYYRGIVAAVRESGKPLHVVGFTATEYEYMSRSSGIPVAELLAEFRDAGVNALPGGGAEIFAPQTRERIAPKKISAERWLEIMGLAHAAGLRSNATLLYNHIETHEDIADHLKRLRDLQDETGGFKALVPLPFHGEHTQISSRRERPSGMDTFRLFAAARIYLDNFDHIKALWMYLGAKVVQSLLHFGADDVGATYLNEKIVHAAGASTPRSGSEQALRQMIRQSGFFPIRTNAGYE